MHVASAGEYLQVKSLISIFVEKKINVFITVTSISGYNWLKRENNNNIVFDFLPLDFSWNAKKIIKLIQPSILIFVKTDIWPGFLREAKKNNIPRVLVSAPARRPVSGLKKSYYKFLYENFTAVFPVTDEGKLYYKNILEKSTPVEVAGDGKYDIVFDRKKERSISLSAVTKTDICALLGSVWPEDLNVIINPVLKAMEQYPDLKIIVAPHENDRRHVDALVNLFAKFKPALFSDLKVPNPSREISLKLNFRVLIVDTIGDLFFLYENSHIAYVGGGFSTGIHNILEPCAMKNAVIFGPRYQKFPEAEKILEINAACSISNTAGFESVFLDLLANKKKRLEKAKACYDFVSQHKGASQKLFKAVQKIIS